MLSDRSRLGLQPRSPAGCGGPTAALLACPLLLQSAGLEVSHSLRPASLLSCSALCATAVPSESREHLSQDLHLMQVPRQRDSALAGTMPPRSAPCRWQSIWRRGLRGTIGNETGPRPVQPGGSYISPENCLGEGPSLTGTQEGLAFDELNGCIL